MISLKIKFHHSLLMLCWGLEKVFVFFWVCLTVFKVLKVFFTSHLRTINFEKTFSSIVKRSQTEWLKFHLFPKTLIKTLYLFLTLIDWLGCGLTRRSAHFIIFCLKSAKLFCTLSPNYILFTQPRKFFYPFIKLNLSLDQLIIEFT